MWHGFSYFEMGSLVGMKEKKKRTLGRMRKGRTIGESVGGVLGYGQNPFAFAGLHPAESNMGLGAADLVVLMILVPCKSEE
jgi:hypothetical protein